MISKFQFTSSIWAALRVDGEQPLQQAVARLDGRPAVGAVAGLVHAPLAGVAPPVRGESVLLPEAAPLERQPRLAHAEAPGDGGARLRVVPQGGDLLVVDHDPSSSEHGTGDAKSVACAADIDSAATPANKIFLIVFLP